jgi:hypothetical protein
MNESVQLESNLIIWSARDRWVFRAVGALFGLIWGSLGVVMEALLLRGGVIPSLTENPASIDVIVGMVFGVGHASQFWLARARKPVRSWWLEVLVWAMVCVALGILWGSPVAMISSQFTLNPGLPVGFLFLMPFFGVLLSVYTVLPAAILMAPVTVLVWQKALERLQSRQLVNQPERPSI